MALLAIGFGYGGMLLWAAAAAIPVLIHLFSRGKRRQTVWAAMRFLEAAVQKNVRRIRFEQWLLLAVRVAILALLALALADPWLKTDAPTSGGAEAAQHWVFVVNASYSMQQRSGDQTAIEQAKRRIEELVDSATAGDGFSLLLMGEPAQAIVAEPSFDREQFLAEVRQLQMQDAGADLSSALRETIRLLDQAERQEPRLKRRRVVWVSDRQAVTWSAVESSACREILAKLARSADLRLATVGDGDLVENLAATRLDADGGAVLAGRATPLSTAIQSFANSPQDVACQLLVQGRVVLRQTLTVPAGAVTSWRPTYEFPDAGFQQVEVVIGEDALTIDNTARCVVEVRDAIQVLCIEGSPGAARAVALALDPNDAVSRRIQWEISAETALLERDLSQYDSLWLCNVARFHRDEALVLDRYLRQGGCVMMFLGPQAQAANYNEELVERLGWLPARLDSPAGRGEYVLDPLDYRHWLTQPFAGAPNAGLLSTPIWNYWRLQPRAGSRTAMAIQGDGAVFVEQEVGRGLAVLCGLDAAHPAGQDPSQRWSGLSAWPSFPPLVQQIADAFARRKRQGFNLTVGRTLRPSVPPNTTTVSVQSPDGAETALAVSTESQTPNEFGRDPRGILSRPRRRPRAVVRREPESRGKRSQDMGGGSLAHAIARGR